MNTFDEPEDGSYILVAIRSGVQVFHREDHVSVGVGRSELKQRHWHSVGPTRISRTWPLSWQELTELGDIAYVGCFVDRSGKGES